MRRGIVVIVALVALAGGARDDASFVLASPSWPAKLDPALAARASRPGTSSVIVRAAHGEGRAAASHARAVGARIVRDLPIVDGIAIEIANARLEALASNTAVEHLALDRLAVGAMERTGATIGADVVRQQLGYDGSGVGIAVIDSGVNAAHDDLAAREGRASPIVRFVDFVNGRDAAYDDYGHGTHIAGIISGSGYDSGGARTGIAPGSQLVVLKVLDANGRGRISDVIAAIDYAVANRDALHIRIVSLSVASAVYESYTQDPLTLAAQRAVSSGLVVVAAAGNNGRSVNGVTQYAGITSPGNAPSVLTVGASSHMGTADRADDAIAAFSSRGPGAIDFAAKPDIVAPGVGIESLTDPSSSIYAAAGAALLPGTIPTSYLPYVSLSGTSMSAPVVTGAVALMLQANPALTPNAVKAILQYTAQRYAGYDALTQGAGFLNAKGAVELASYLASPSTRPYPSTTGWSRQIVWGNHLVDGGRLTADANAWSLGVTWGAIVSPLGDRIRWGVTCLTAACDSINAKAWQSGDLLSWTNVVWGSLCAGIDCMIPWQPREVTATTDPEADTVVWGTVDTEADTVVWGTTCADPACDPFVWRLR